MKKLLTLVLVLGMASAASATLQISVHTDPPGDETWDPMNPQDTDIEIGYSDTLMLDIWTDADIAFFGGDQYAIVVDTLMGSIEGGVALDVGVNVTNVVNGPTQDNEGVIPPPGMEGIWGLVRNLNTAYTVPAGTVIVDGLIFHCEGYGDAVVQLYHLDEGAPMDQLLDQVVIHQTPEPMTLGLLGLGGLGLLRRRRS